MSRSSKLPALLALLALVAAAAPSTPAAATTLGALRVAVNIANQAELTDVLNPAGLRPLLRPTDVFVLVSGNSTGTPNLTWLAEAATSLHQAFPTNDIRILTSGQTNVDRLVQARATIPSYVRSLGYDYEPNRANEPEFAWDFPTTTGNVTTAAQHAQAGGFTLFDAPTGRALLQANLQTYGWDYARLSVSDAGQITQLQTYCKTSTTQYLTAITKLRSQAIAGRVPLNRYFPQVTVDTGAANVNGVTATQARDCAQQAANQGFSRISLWWDPNDSADAEQFLQLLGR